MESSVYSIVARRRAAGGSRFNGDQKRLGLVAAFVGLERSVIDKLDV